jgi:hypothetical protein
MFVLVSPNNMCVGDNWFLRFRAGRPSKYNKVSITVRQLRSSLALHPLHLSLWMEYLKSSLRCRELESGNDLEGVLKNLQGSQGNPLSGLAAKALEHFANIDKNVTEMLGDAGMEAIRTSVSSTAFSIRNLVAAIDRGENDDDVLDNTTVVVYTIATLGALAGPLIQYECSSRLPYDMHHLLMQHEYYSRLSYDTHHLLI